MDLIADYSGAGDGVYRTFYDGGFCSAGGIGTRIVEDLCRHLAEEGIRTVRLCWVKGNPQAEHFWRKKSVCADQRNTEHVGTNGGSGRTEVEINAFFDKM